MKRRVLAAIAAVVLAGVAGVLLTSYVRAADDRAMAGMEAARVLVVTTMVSKGTAAETLQNSVTVETLPVMAIAPGSLTDLALIVGQVSTVDLQPGEQLLSSRFVDPATLEDPNLVKVPPGMQQLSITMERPRMLGSLLTPGATVGVFVSLPKDGEQPAQTHLVLNKVLVTDVGAQMPPEGDAQAGVPSETVAVTFAVKARDAEKIVFGAEHGRLWLSLEPADARTKGTRVLTSGNVYE